MYPNLAKAMSDIGITQLDIANRLGESPYWIQNRLQGKVKPWINDAVRIQRAFFPDTGLTYLFSTVEGELI